MAKDKEKTEETPDEKVTPEVTSEQKEYVDSRTKEFLGENNTDPGEKSGEESSKETPKEVSEKPKEEVKEEPKKTEEEKPVEIDTSEIKKEISQDVTDKIVQALTGGKKEEDLSVKSPWAREGRNPRDWDEVAEWTKEQAKAELKAEREADDKLKNEQQAQLEQKTQESIKQWNEYWDSQTNDLRATGKLPAITNKDDENDPGVKAQRELFKQLKEVNEQRVTKGLPIITSVKEFFYEGYKAPNSQPSGADAPVSGGKTATISGSEDEFAYEDVHQSKGFFDIFKR